MLWDIHLWMEVVLEILGILHQSIILCPFSDWVFLIDTGRVKGPPPSPQQQASKGLKCKDCSVLIPGVKMYMGMWQGGELAH